MRHGYTILDQSLKSELRPNVKMFVYKIQVNPILKINNSWPELLNFQNSFICYLLELLRTVSLPIYEVIIYFKMV